MSCADGRLGRPAERSEAAPSPRLKRESLSVYPVIPWGLCVKGFPAGTEMNQSRTLV